MLSRKLLKKTLPKSFLKLLEALRRHLNGPGIESDVLENIQFEPDLNPNPRVTFIITNLHASQAFGGVMTALELMTELRPQLKKSNIDFRIVSNATINQNDNVLTSFPDLLSDEVFSLVEQHQTLKLRAREICFVYNWWLSTNLSNALKQQAEHFSQKEMPRIHLIQDYEPSFYPYSTAHILAHQSLGLGDKLWGIFNTSELFRYWERQNHKAAKTFILEPKMNEALKPYSQMANPPQKSNIILVYGRPNVPRNAFFLVKRALKTWAQKYGHKHTEWEICSAGVAHENIQLHHDHEIKSLGKLTLEDYAKLLQKAAIGISLMVSPHPSYPPLEMAHFGIRVITNSYTDKQPQLLHDNLRSLMSFDQDEMAKEIENEIMAFESNPNLGLDGKSHMPNFLEGGGFECTTQLAESITKLLVKTT